MPARPPRRTRRTTYLRFAVGRVDADSREQLGIFQASYDLRQSNQLAPNESERLRELLTWFDNNLHSPSVAQHAIFWFRSDAAESLQRIWQLVALLKSHSLVVWMMRTDSPGRIVYHDQFQVAGVPHRRRAWKRRPV